MQVARKILDLKRKELWKLEKDIEEKEVQRMKRSTKKEQNKKRLN